MNFQKYIEDRKKRTLVTDEIKEIKEKMIEEVISDKKFWGELCKIGITSRELLSCYISTIYECKKENDYCKKCPKLINCAKRYPHYQIKLNFKNNFVKKILVPCELKQIEMKKDLNYLVRDFPNEWLNCELSDARGGGRQKDKVIQKYIRINQSSKNWIYIIGNHQSGKTKLAACIAQDAASSGYKIAFLDYPFRVNELSDLSFNYKNDFNKKMKDYKLVDVLVLDNFGDEYKNDFIRDNITLSLLNERARLGLLTIFTSTFDYEEIRNMYATTSAGRTHAKKLEELLEDFADIPFDVSN